MAKSVKSVEDAVGRIRIARGMNAKHVLVIAIDELVRLRDPLLCASFLQAAMCCMDASEGSTVFVFSALLESDISKWRGNSNRQLYESAPPLSLLSIEAVDAVVRREAGAAARLLDVPAVYRMLLQCAGHPRAVFDFFLPFLRQLFAQFPSGAIPSAAITSAMEAQHVHHKDSNAEIAGSFDEVLGRETSGVTKKLAVEDTLVTGELVRTLLSPVEALDEAALEDLHRSGLCVEGRVLPIFLRQWAANHSKTEKETNTSAIARYLYAALCADDTAGPGSEVFAEQLVYSLDACRRLSLGDQSCSLKYLYFGAIVNSTIGRVTVCPPGGKLPQDLVYFVQSFEDDSVETLEKLRLGHVVVSKFRLESGIEYLVPVWDSNHVMHVLGIQIKFQMAGDSLASLASKVMTKLVLLMAKMSDPKLGKPLACIITTHKTNPQNYPDNSIWMNRVGFAAYTRQLGPLRMLLEKTLR
jgi:hypothetical protein